jgi:hypothetical protein
MRFVGSGVAGVTFDVEVSKRAAQLRESTGDLGAAGCDDLVARVCEIGDKSPPFARAIPERLEVRNFSPPTTRPSSCSCRIARALFHSRCSRCVGDRGVGGLARIRNGGLGAKRDSVVIAAVFRQGELSPTRWRSLHAMGT